MEGEGHIYANMIVLAQAYERGLNSTFGVNKTAIQSAINRQQCIGIHNYFKETKADVSISQVKKAVLRDIYSAILIDLITDLKETKKQFIKIKYNNRECIAEVPSKEDLSRIAESLSSATYDQETESRLNKLIGSEAYSNICTEEQAAFSKICTEEQTALANWRAFREKAAEFLPDNETHAELFDDTYIDEEDSLSDSASSDYHNEKRVFLISNLSYVLRDLENVDEEVDLYGKQIIDNAFESLKIPQLKENFYLLGCYLKQVAVGNDHLPNYVISHEEYKLYSNSISAEFRNREIENELQNPQHPLNKRFGINIPYFLLGSIAPDFFKMQLDGHHIDPAPHNDSSSLRIRDQLHALLLKAQTYASERRIRETWYCLGVFLHLAFDAMVVSRGYKKRLLNSRRYNNIVNMFKHPDIDKMVDDIHKGCDNYLFAIIRRICSTGCFKDFTMNSVPSYNKQLEIANLIDKMSASFACINISNSPIDREVITYNGAPAVKKNRNEPEPESFPIRNMVNCAAEVIRIIANSIPSVGGRQKDVANTFANVYVKRKDHKITIVSFKNSCFEKYSNPYVVTRVAHYYYLDFINSKLRPKYRKLQLQLAQGCANYASFCEYAPGRFKYAEILLQLYHTKSPRGISENSHFNNPKTKAEILNLLKSSAEAEYEEAVKAVCRFPISKYGKYLGFKNVEYFGTLPVRLFEKMEKEHHLQRISDATYSKYLLSIGIYHIVKSQTNDGCFEYHIRQVRKHFEKLTGQFSDLTCSIYPHYYMGKYHESCILSIKNPLNLLNLLQKETRDKNMYHIEQALKHFKKVKSFNQDTNNLYISKELFGDDQINHTYKFMIKYGLLSILS